MVYLNGGDVVLGLIIFTALLLYGAILFIKNLLFLKKSEILIGVIKNMKLKDDIDGFFNVPVIEYYDNEEQKSFTFESHIQNIKHKIGDEIEIRIYKNGSKRICEVNRPILILMGPSLPLIMGIGGCIKLFIEIINDI